MNINVNSLRIDYTQPQLASLVKRWCGQVLDSMIPFAVLGLFVAVIFSVVDNEAIRGAMLLSCLALYVFYILFADGLHQGQSFGKRILGARVVDASTGKPCTYVQSLIRNIFYVFGILDWIFIFGEKRQRLGDRVANTIVVED